MPMLELRNVETFYGNIMALKGISLSVTEGEIITLIGANGAGKSTTLMTICGIVPPAQRRDPLHGKADSAAWNRTRSSPWASPRSPKGAGSFPS